MIALTCHVCRTALSAQDSQAGQLVRCPTCRTVLTVPALAEAVTTPAASTAAGSPGAFQGSLGTTAPGRRFAFQCGYCSSRLEANQSMSGQEGNCPTCDSKITIPILLPDGRLRDPKTQEIIKPDPHPVHAYAAAGARAPQIVRLADGKQAIQCAHCTKFSPITANICATCGMPFTLEGTATAAPGTSNSICTASMVLGILSLFASCTVILPILSIIFGIVGIAQANKADQPTERNKAIAGIACSVIGGVIFILIIHH